MKEQSDLVAVLRQEFLRAEFNQVGAKAVLKWSTISSFSITFSMVFAS
jgi:hypothetical protein